MLKRLAAYFGHHLRFYTALICGGLAYAGATVAGMPNPALAAGDSFYGIFLILCLALLISQKPGDLKKRAKNEDEGIVIVMLITIATIGYFCLAVFDALSKKHGLNMASLVMAAMGAVLGWFVLHSVMALHYANIHYFDDPDCPDDDDRDLDFPGKGDPGVMDFLYFSFVIGMTCQVSDVQVKTRVMRRAVLAHGVAAFFFNTVFIAMAVNAAVSLAA